VDATVRHSVVDGTDGEQQLSVDAVACAAPYIRVIPHARQPRSL